MTLAPLTLIRFLPPLALMAAIFFLSAQSDLSTDLGLIDLIGRKVAHAAVYGGLALLWFWALLPVMGPGPGARHGHGDGEGQGDNDGRGDGDGDRSGRSPAWSGPSRTLTVAAAISFLYAISDEYHQSHVDGRVGSPVDVAIDTLGILIAAWLVSSGRLAALLTAIRSRRA